MTEKEIGFIKLFLLTTFVLIVSIFGVCYARSLI